MSTRYDGKLLDVRSRCNRNLRPSGPRNDVTGPGQYFLIEKPFFPHYWQNRKFQSDHGRRINTILPCCPTGHTRTAPRSARQSQYVLTRLFATKPFCIEFRVRFRTDGLYDILLNSIPPDVAINLNTGKGFRNFAAATQRRNGRDLWTGKQVAARRVSVPKRLCDIINTTNNNAMVICFICFFHIVPIVLFVLVRSSCLLAKNAAVFNDI